MGQKICLRYKNIFERVELGKFVNFGQLHCYWIRIQESQINPDPNQQNTAKTTRQITAEHGDTYQRRIHNVADHSKTKKRKFFKW